MSSKTKSQQRRAWTAEEDAFMRDQYAHRQTSDLARELNRSMKSVYMRATLLGLHKDAELIAEMSRRAMASPAHRGRKAQFRKGQQAWNRGVLHSTGFSETRFKQGNRPQTWVPIGTLRVTKDGILERKVADTRVKRNDWRPVHVLVWEAAHGPVPTGHVVIFRPGRKTVDAEAITADALECLARPDLMLRNSIHTNYPPEIAHLCRLRGVLSKQINKRAKEST